MKVRVTIAQTLGSVPRDTGAIMWVLDDGQTMGSIGGGVLEYRALSRAQQMLGNGETAVGRIETLDLPLGPTTGQCCGGHVKVVLELCDDDLTGAANGNHNENDNDQIVYIYGAGHVGQALRKALEPLPFQVFSVDERADYPAEHRDYLHTARTARMGAWHLIMTHSHAIDLALCAELLNAGQAGHIGLIGSRTKRARFFTQLRAQGLDPSPIVCPIGVVGARGKEPEIIAAATACELLILRAAKQASGTLAAS